MIKDGTKRIEILGIPYEIVLYDDFKVINKVRRELDEFYRIDGKEPEEPENVDGFIDYNRKQIHICIDPTYHTTQIEQIIRHELTHGFLYEIGYTHHGDEDLIDKLAKWVPQLENLYKTFTEVIDGNKAKSSKRTEESK